MNILELEGITKQFGSQTALADLSLTIPEGKIVGLLGPNGSGKTTMIKIITGLISSHSGTAQICGHPVGPASSNLVSYLPDRLHLPSWLKVSEAVKFFADFYQDFDTVRANAMLERMQIPQDKSIKALSKGMCEKLQLVLVMSRQTKFYILDEPIAAVDPAARDFILQTILQNFAEGSSILISTHLISDIEAVLDDAIFLKEGQIVLHDNVEQIRTQNQKSLDQLFREVFKC